MARYVRNSIKTKIMISFLVVIIFPTACISISSYSISKALLTDRVSESFMDNLSYLGQSLEFDMREWERVMDLLQVNHTIESIFIEKYENDINYFFDVKKANQVFDDWAYASNMYTYISSLVVIGDNGKILRYGEDVGRLDTDDLMQKDWTQKLDQSKGGLVWLGVHENYADIHYRNPYVVSLTKQLDYKKSKAVVFLSFKAQFFFEKLNTKHDPNNDMFLLDSDHRIVYNRDSTKINQLYENQLDFEGKGYSTITDQNGVKRLIAKVPIANTGWNVVETIPLKVLTQGSSRIFEVTTIVFILSFLVSGLIWFIITSRIVNPIQRLASTMNRVRGNEGSVKTEIDSKDEIGQLNKSFNYMMKRIDRLHQDNLREQADKNDAEYRALQAQINPHFLYNTLNSIRWMAMIQKADNIREIVEVLGRLLRNTIKMKDKIIPISVELELIKDYIQIQKIRYNDKFEVEYLIDEDISESLTLKFILQPIIENAIFHGIEPKDGRGTIQIRIFQESGALILEVYDNGVGMPPEIVDNLLSAQDEKGSIGLRNVHERIQRTFGEPFGVSIESECGVYTKVRIKQPIIELPQEERQ